MASGSKGDRLLRSVWSIWSSGCASQRRKGNRAKGYDSLTAALCPPCHERIDNGKDLSREERRSEMDRAIVLTLQKLTREGRVTVR